MVLCFVQTEGKLRKIDPATGEAGSEPFEFNVSSDHAYNQKRYEALGEVKQFFYLPYFLNEYCLTDVNTIFLQYFSSSHHMFINF